ncbi:unnamed protein product [Enterobius vermicularis]|uniref:AMP-binding domain-containing protein n=1 Tax=Enterobius vermicularis TaxID=51028 RepID=A0A158QAD2_ENTVE|nr:unnamed protein product [Enterobius vermicularis]
MPIESQLPPIDIPEIPFHQMILNEFSNYRSEVAVINYDTGESVTYGEIIDNAYYIAKSLVALGAVILCVDMSPEFVWLFLGISIAGAVVCCLSPDFSKDEMRFQITDSAARFAFVTPNAIQNLAAVFCELEYVHRIICVGKREESFGYPIIKDLALSAASSSSGFPEIDPENDLVMLPYSCGTSGPRKGVAIFHYILNGMIKIFNNRDAYDLPERGDFVAIKVCVHDAFGRDSLFSSLLNGATVVCTAKSEDIFAKCIEQHKVRICFLSPLILKRLCVLEIVEKTCLSSLEVVVIGTAKAHESTMKMAFKLLPSVKKYSAVYGMTEVGSISRTKRNTTFNNLSCGALCAGLSLKVVNLLNGKELPEYSQGLILISGKTVLSPYWNNEKATAEDFNNLGDIGYYDKKGNIFLVDRLKHVIIVDGNQVTPQELEGIFLSNPKVAEAAVVSVHDQHFLEFPIAFVVLKPKTVATQDELLKYVNDRVVSFKRISKVIFTLTLPRSASGKILRRMLRETAAHYV